VFNVISIGGGASFTMRGRARVSGNGDAIGSNYIFGGGVVVFDSTFIMRDSASVSGNRAGGNGGQGGGVFLGAFFGTSTLQIAGGTIYGNDASSTLANIADSYAALQIFISTPGGDAIAQYGTFDAGGIWNSSGNLTRRNNTIVNMNLLFEILSVVHGRKMN
jgi:hypothetical protein